MLPFGSSTATNAPSFSFGSGLTSTAPTAAAPVNPFTFGGSSGTTNAPTNAPFGGGGGGGG